MEKRTPSQQGYDTAIARLREMHKAKTGHSYGAVQWLAERLQVTRQAVDVWGERDGFPPQHVAKVAKITGLPADTVRPPTVTATFPAAVWSSIPKPLIDQATIHPERRK